MLNKGIFLIVSAMYGPVNISMTKIVKMQPDPKISHFDEGCEILEEAPGFYRYSSFCLNFQEKVGESSDTHLPNLLNSTPPPHLHITH